MVLSDEGGTQYPDDEDDVDSARNPFSTRFVQPGVIPYFFEPEFIESIQRTRPEVYHCAFAESLLEKAELSTWVGCRYLATLLAEHRFLGQIIGPHGSGKSTLALSLAHVLERSGHPVFFFAVHDHTRSLPREFYDRFADFENESPPRAVNQNLIFLDGYEQLACQNRLRLRFFARRHRCGLLVTSHRRRCGFPVLMRTAPSFETLQKIVDYLLDDSRILPGGGALHGLFDRRRENFRDILFALYDWYEDADRS